MLQPDRSTQLPIPTLEQLRAQEVAPTLGASAASHVIDLVDGDPEYPDEGPLFYTWRNANNEADRRRALRAEGRYITRMALLRKASVAVHEVSASELSEMSADKMKYGHY